MDNAALLFFPFAQRKRGGGGGVRSCNRRGRGACERRKGGVFTDGFDGAGTRRDRGADGRNGACGIPVQKVDAKGELFQKDGGRGVPTVENRGRWRTGDDEKTVDRKRRVYAVGGGGKRREYAIRSRRGLDGIKGRKIKLGGCTRATAEFLLIQQKKPYGVLAINILFCRR